MTSFSCEIISIKEILEETLIEQFTVQFFQNLFARTDNFTQGLGLTEDQEKYLYEKDTDDEIKIELKEGAVNYLESHRKEVKLQRCNIKMLGSTSIRVIL